MDIINITQQKETGGMVQMLGRIVSCSNERGEIILIAIILFESTKRG